MSDETLWPWMLLGILLALPSLPGTIELLLLTLGGILPPRRETDPKTTTPIGRIAILVPAHDEAEGIAHTVASLRACDPGDAGFEVVVIADNCTDETAELARSAGARVLERHDLQRRGKGYALDFAFGILLAEPFDAFIVVDADTRVAPNLVTEQRRLMRRGAAAVQCGYRINNPQHSLRARLRGIAWMAFNVLRLRGRERWRLSVGLLGNGFGLTRETLLNEPYEATSVVEDMEYHLRLVAAGRRVVFAPNTGVWSDAPYTREAGAGQRARWEGGRFRMIRDWTPILLRRVLSGERRLIEPLLELLLLPLAFHMLLLLLALLPPFGPTRTYALLGLALVAVHVLAAIRIGGGGWRDLLALATAPVYILWKLTILRAIGRASRTDAAWVRTERNDTERKESGRAMPMSDSPTPDVSVVIVSFNTRDLLVECIETLIAEAGAVSHEIIVVDNASRDGSAERVAERFPQATLIRSATNLGFAAANNLGFKSAHGRYLVLLNSDAFLESGALERAVHYMDEDPGIGLGGARLIGRDGEWQPSARMFPSLLIELLTLSGLAARFPRSRFFGRFDRTWADPTQPADVDWVPGAFSIVRRDLLARIGDFDESFFLYYEEVDLCRRIRAAGLRIRYWPDVVVVHIGGESSRTHGDLDMSAAGKGAQLTLWRMRSGLLYYRKHHGWLGAWGVRQLEATWHRIRAWRNRGDDPQRRTKRTESLAIVALLDRAWCETAGGHRSPSRPW